MAEREIVLRLTVRDAKGAGRIWRLEQKGETSWVMREDGAGYSGAAVGARAAAVGARAAAVVADRVATWIDDMDEEEVDGG